MGLDGGQINIAEIPRERSYQVISEGVDVPVHSARVMGVTYDPVRRLMHSVGKDRKYCVWS